MATTRNRIVQILCVLAVLAGLLSVQPAGAQDGDADLDVDTSTGTTGDYPDNDVLAGNGQIIDAEGDGAAPAGPDTHEQAAMDNQLAEHAGTVAEPAGAAAPSIESDSAPFAPTEADAGTSSAADLGADAATDEAALSPYLSELTSTSPRWRAVDLDVDALEAAAAAESVSLTLFDDVVVDVTSDFAPSVAQEGSTVWSASADGVAVVGSFVDGSFLGTADVGGTLYTIAPVGDGTHIVAEDVRPGLSDRDNDERSAADNPHADHDAAPAPAAADDGPPAEAAPEVPVVDVYMVYDTSTLNFYGSQLLADQAMVALINTVNVALDNTVDARVNVALVGIDYYNYAGNADGNPTYLDDLTGNGDGILDGVHAARAANGADLVHLMSAAVNDVCGVAWRPNAEAHWDAVNGFGLTDPGCNNPGLIVAHELGHNFGLNHEKANSSCWQDVPETCFYNDGFGYNTFSPSQRTVMSYNTCGSSPCTRMAAFSDPSTNLGGWVTGVLNNQDNARILEARDLDVAAYVSGTGGNGVAGIDGISCAFATIENAISVAPAGSTIYIAPGTHQPVSSGSNFNIGKTLDFEQGTVDCEPTTSGAATNVILTQHPSSTVDAVVDVFGNADVRFERITIQNGNSAEGTLHIYNGADVTLEASHVRNGNNPSTTIGGGGVRIDGATASLTTNSNSQIYNNSSSFGGGAIYVSDGTVTINGTDDIETSNAPDGGGIYATASATVNLQANADVQNNTATSQGGGVYLDASVLNVTGFGTLITGNTVGSSQGGGVYGTNNSDINVGDDATISNNGAGYGAGVWLGGAGSRITLDDDGTVTGNTASVNGGGVMVSNSATADFNSGSRVTNNDAASFGGGVAVLGTAALLDVDGGTPTVDPVVISGNSAGTQGGGIYTSGQAVLDTVHLHTNDATDGGGIYGTAAATVNVIEDWGCDAADTSFEQFCNEFRGNSATGGGSAVFMAGGSFDAVQTAFIGNTAPGAVIRATGAADIDIRAAMALSNSVTLSDGVVTALDTSDVNIIGVTFAANDNRAMDSDTGTTVWNVARVISTSGVWNLDNATGSCNIRSPGQPGVMPGQVSVDPRFEPSIDTAYMPAPTGPAGDRCDILGGFVADVNDFGVKDADGVASATEYDVGGVEADRQPIITPGAIGGPEGNAGITTFPVPVRLDIPSTETITVDWITVDSGAPGIATANVDYIQASGTVTFLPGSVEESVDISVIGDLTPEANLFLGEWLPIVFGNPSINAELNVQLFFGLGLAIIANDDGPPP